jgi:hypothetical protein
LLHPDHSPISRFKCTGAKEVLSNGRHIIPVLILSNTIKISDTINCRSLAPPNRAPDRALAPAEEGAEEEAELEFFWSYETAANDCVSKKRELKGNGEKKTER